MAEAFPVILCGRTEQIGQGVIKDLEPEYEVIHFVLNASAGAKQIPLLLKDQQNDVPSDSSLGSKNYAKVPVAVLLGGGYEDDQIKEMMDATNAVEGAKKVPWLRPDLTKPTPPLGPEYGKALVRRIKETLRDILAREVDMEEARVVWY
ncbi:MAG: hypothetical protein Q9227_002582 [Pyrenula ochraceoflavens]